MSAEQDSEAKGIQTLTFSVASIGDNVLVAAVAGQRDYILGIHFATNGGANNVSLQDSGTANLRSPAWVLGADVDKELRGMPKGRWWERTAEGTGLDMNLSAATAVSGVLVYQQF